VSSAENERIAADSDYDPPPMREGAGEYAVDRRKTRDDILDVLAATSASPVIISSRVGLVRAGERLWNFVVPQGHVALLGITARNYDVFLQKRRIPTETIATVLLRIEDNEPKGIADILFHSGTTLSPGELLIRGRYTSVSDVVRTGNGLVTASIKTFPPQFFDEVAGMLRSLDGKSFSGLIEMKGQLPPAYRMSYRDREKGYMLVYGGANFFAPSWSSILRKTCASSHALYDIFTDAPLAELRRDRARDAEGP
jgi:repressor of nif and glnA expression